MNQGCFLFKWWDLEELSTPPIVHIIKTSQATCARFCDLDWNCLYYYKPKKHTVQNSQENLKSAKAFVLFLFSGLTVSPLLASLPSAQRNVYLLLYSTYVVSLEKNLNVAIFSWEPKSRCVLLLEITSYSIV